MWTNFNNSFTVAFSDELRRKNYHLTSDLLPHNMAQHMLTNEHTNKHDGSHHHNPM